MEETERSLHDAIMIVRRAIKNDAVVAGGGAIEMEVSKYLRDCSRSVAGKEQLIIAAMAKGTRFILLRQLHKAFILILAVNISHIFCFILALEIIPRQLCDNAGFDATNILNKLRQKHAQGNLWYGVDILNEDISDNYEVRKILYSSLLYLGIFF